MRIILNKISAFGVLLSLNKLLKFSNKKILCILYHTVNNNDSLHTKHLYLARSKEQFINDLDYLQKHFNFISSAQLAEGNYEATRPSIHLSFDDGMKECFKIIYPILKERKIPATFFINPAFIDNKQMFHCHKASLLKDTFLQDPNKYIAGKINLSGTPSIQKQPDQYYEALAKRLNVNFDNYLLENEPYMRLSELQELATTGFEFGAHTMTHPLLNDIDDNDKVQEIAGSIKWIRDNRLLGHGYFAFPFHDIGITMNIFDTIKQQNVKLSFGTSELKDDAIPGHYHRISFENSTVSAKRIIKEKLFKYILLKIIGKNKITRV